MKVMKILGIILLVIIAFVGLSIYMTANNINAIVKQAVEHFGSEALQTQVTLAEADISLTESRAMLSGLTIRNVAGFGSDNIFEMDTVIVDLNLEAILEQTIDLREVTIRGMRVIAEQKGATTNVQQLMNNLPSGKGQSTQPSDTGPATEGAEFLIKVGKFEFADSSTTLVTEQWGDQKVEVPAIVLSNLGGANGVPPEQLASEIFKPLLKQINAAAQAKLKDVVEDKAKEKLKEKEDELKDKYRGKLKDELGDDSEQVEGALKSLLSR